MTDDSGTFNLDIQPDIYEITLQSYAFFDNSVPEFHSVVFDNLGSGSENRIYLINDTHGYNKVNITFSKAYMNGNVSYRIYDALGAEADFSAQDLSLIFQIKKGDDCKCK